MRITLPKEDLLRELQTNPEVTGKQLGEIFGVSESTIQRVLCSYGLKTKGWHGRKHTAESKKKLSSTLTESGVRRGERNANFGVKERPWLEGDRHPLRKWHADNPGFGDTQRGAANPVHKAAHLYEDPSYVQKITSGIRAHVSSKKGHTYEEIYGAEQAAEYKRKLREASPARLAKFIRKTTWPEQAVAEILSGLGVDYTEQVPIGYYTVDFYVSSRRLVIQADGDYWHGNPIKYPAGKLSQTQRKQKRLDASCDRYLQNQGHDVLRLWELDLHKNHHSCVALIEETLRKTK